MKKIIIALLSFSLFTSLIFAETNSMKTNSSVGFQPAYTEGENQNEYGDKIMYQDVKITTKDFKINNFWGTFSDTAENQSSFTNISTSAKVKLTISGTSACTLDNMLPSQGCSGQKPFLLNNEVLTNPIAGTDDEYEVVFTKATDYANNDYNGFYPLDILRDPKYYEDINTTTGTATQKHTFFGFITGAIDYLFQKTTGNAFFGQKDIANVKYDPRSDAAEDRRQRYIANIMGGIDQDHRLKQAIDNVSATTINAPTLNTPPSLLDYNEAKRTTSTSECKFLFLSLSSDGYMCRIMTGFGMDAWMPFFNETNTTKVQSSFILADTENALLAMAGEINKIPYMKDVGGNDDNKLTFLQNMLKPMKTMFNFMKGIFFGSSKKIITANPVERVISFPDDKAMMLTFAITNDGSQIDSFEHFKLLKIRSVYGDNINSCTVHKSRGAISWSKWTDTFYEGGNISHKSPNYTWLNREVWNNDQWLDWCQKATGNKGMFDYLFNWKTGAFFNPINWMKGFFQAFLNFLSGEYSIENFANTIHRGLILNLKKIDISDINASTPLTTTEFKIMNMKRGH